MFKDIQSPMASFSTPTVLLLGLLAFYLVLAIFALTIWAVRRSRRRRQKIETERNQRQKQSAKDQRDRQTIQRAIETLQRDVDSIRREVACYRDAGIQSADETVRLSSEVLQVNLRLANLEARSQLDFDQEISVELMDNRSGMTLDADRGWIFDEPPKQIDDLTQIWGIGPHYQRQLRRFGIYQFEQIAQWNHAVINHFETLFSFKGRIGREKWVDQASRLAHQPATRIAA